MTVIAGIGRKVTLRIEVAEPRPDGRRCRMPLNMLSETGWRLSVFSQNQTSCSPRVAARPAARQPIVEVRLVDAVAAARLPVVDEVDVRVDVPPLPSRSPS